MAKTSKKTFPMLYKRTSGGGTQEWEIWVEPGDGGVGVMITRYGLQGGKKQTQEEIISNGKNAGKKNETTPYAQACLEAEARWNKKKDRGQYGLDVETSAAVRGLSPMLAQVFKDHKRKVSWETAFAQPKLDGFRCIARKDHDGKVTLLSRENQPLTNLRHLYELLTATLPEGSVLDGELYKHGFSLPQISSACKKVGGNALTEQIEYHVYDSPMDNDFGTRYHFVKGVVEAVNDPRLVAVETVKVRSEGELMLCQGQFLEAGYEGAMLRHGAVGYQAGKRSPHLLKVKTFTDDEFRIIDFKMGRGKYEGVPVFTCETADGHPFDVTAHGTMEEKRALGRMAKMYVGQRLTVKYLYFTKTDEPVPYLPVAKCFASEK